MLCHQGWAGELQPGVKRCSWSPIRGPAVGSGKAWLCPAVQAPMAADGSLSPRPVPFSSGVQHLPVAVPCRVIAFQQESQQKRAGPQVRPCSSSLPADCQALSLG